MAVRPTVVFQPGQPCAESARGAALQMCVCVERLSAGPGCMLSGCVCGRFGSGEAELVRAHVRWRRVRVTRRAGWPGGRSLGERGPTDDVFHAGLDPFDAGTAPVSGGGDQRGVPAAHACAGAGAGATRVAVERDPLRDQVAELPAGDLRRLLPDVDQAERLAVLQDDDGGPRRAGVQHPVRRRAGQQADPERHVLLRRRGIGRRDLSS